MIQCVNVYRDPRWASTSQVPVWIIFLSATKYPASLLFLLMTLGPTIAALPLLEGCARLHRAMAGRLRACAAVLLPTAHSAHTRGGRGHFAGPFACGDRLAIRQSPDESGWAARGYTWSLGLLYAVTAAVVVALYFPCRWFASSKSGERTRGYRTCERP